MEQKQTISDFFLPLLLIYTNLYIFLYFFFLLIFFRYLKNTFLLFFYYRKLGLVGNKYGNCELSVT